MYTTYLALDALSGFKCRASITDGNAQLEGVALGSDDSSNCLVIDDLGDCIECFHDDDRIEIRGAVFEDVVNTLLKHSRSIAKWELELSRIVSEGDPKDIVDSLAKILNCPTLIVDTHNMMCVLCDLDPKDSIYEWDYARSFGRLPWEMFDNMGHSMIFQSRLLSSQDKPFTAAICEDGRESIFCRIEVDDSPTMYLIAFDSGRGISPGMVQITSLASSTIVLWLEAHRAQSGVFSITDTLSRLALGDEVSAQEVRAERLRMAADGTSFVLMKIVHQLSGGHARAASVFQSRFARSRCFVAGDNLYALCVDYPSLEKDLSRLAASNNNMRFGLSWRFTDWSAISDAVNQTEVALSNSAGSVAVLDSHCVMFYIFSILMSSTSNIEMIHPAITSLETYDDVHGSEYLRTLWVFLRHERNLVNTAEDLGIHRNSLVYRVKRISELIPDVDLDDPETREHLIISYRIRGLRQRSQPIDSY